MHCSDVYDDSADWVIPVSAGQTVPAISAGVPAVSGILFMDQLFPVTPAAQMLTSRLDLSTTPCFTKRAALSMSKFELHKEEAQDNTD